MNRARLALLAVAAGILTLMALPATRWVVLNHADYVWGLRSRPALQDIYSPSGRGPDLSLDDEQRFSKSEAIALGAAYEDAEAYRQDDWKKWSLLDKVAPLRRFVETHPANLPARALMMSMASSTVISTISGERPVDPVVIARAKDCRDVMAFAFEGVGRLDPDNAYFPTLMGLAEFAVGRKAEARSLWIDASRKSRYDEYAFEAAKARYEADEDHYGYRGERARFVTLASYMLPANSAIPRLAGKLCRNRDREARIATARLAKTVMKTSPIAIDLYMGARMASIAAIGGELSAQERQSQDARRSAAEEGIEKIEASGQDRQGDVRSAFAMAERVRRVELPEFGGHAMDVLPWAQLSWWVAQGTWLGIAMLAVGSALLGRAIAWKGRHAQLWANAVWPMAWLFGPPEGSAALWTLVAVLVVQALLYGFATGRAERYWWVVSTLGAGVVALMGQADWPWLSWIAGLFLVASVLSRVEVRPVWGKALAFNLLTLGCALPLAMHFASDQGLRFNLPLVLGVFVSGTLCALGISPKMKDVPRHSYAWAVAAMAALYLVAVGFELRADRSLAGMERSMVHEADGLRGRAGI